MDRPPSGSDRARSSHNLFFALWPDESVRAGIEAAARVLERTHAPRGRWIKPPRYHLTLRFLGEFARLPDDLVAAACDAGDRVRADAFGFSLDVAGSFANRHIPWWLGCRDRVDALVALRNGIADGLRANGQPLADRESEPVAHVTILRDADRPLPPTPIAPIEWPVDAFVLIDSELGPRPRYAMLRRWPLPK